MRILIWSERQNLPFWTATVAGSDRQYLPVRGGKPEVIR
jgi:hypothetical protein